MDKVFDLLHTFLGEELSEDGQNKSATGNLVCTILLGSRVAIGKCCSTYRRKLITRCWRIAIDLEVGKDGKGTFVVLSTVDQDVRAISFRPIIVVGRCHPLVSGGGSICADMDECPVKALPD